MADQLTCRQFDHRSAAAAAALTTGLESAAVRAGQRTGADPRGILNYNPDIEYRRCGKTKRWVAIGWTGVALLLYCQAVLTAPSARSVVWAADNDGRPRRSPPPLVVDKDAPLLLDDPAPTVNPTAAAATPAATENQACFVCHANYQDEPLVTIHTKQNVACTECHGTSYPHRNDENNTTPPDIMYPAAAIGPACRKCHETHDVPPEQVVLRWLERCPAKKPPELVCTDCHGRHRLATRTVRWNKKTRQLIRPEQAPSVVPAP